VRDTVVYSVGIIVRDGFGPSDELGEVGLCDIMTPVSSVGPPSDSAPSGMGSSEVGFPNVGVMEWTRDGSDVGSMEGAGDFVGANDGS
jgi:hypothetical protein